MEAISGSVRVSDFPYVVYVSRASVAHTSPRGFYVFNNIIRPLRFGASVLVAKYFDQFVKFIQRKTNLSRRWAIGVVVFLANVCGTFAAMGLGVSIASTAAGVPIFPKKL